MVGVKQIILVFLFLQPLLSQEEEDCDPVFDNCEECDDVRRSFILIICHITFILLRFFVMTMEMNMSMTRVKRQILVILYLMTVETLLTLFQA